MKKIKLLFFVGLFLGIMIQSYSQKLNVAVLNIDTKLKDFDEVSMGNLVRLELEKTEMYTVLDKYDLAYIMKEKEFDISNCYGRICLVEAGKILGADKMLTGSVEKFNNKIVVILRLIDVESGKVEKTNIMEYLDLPEIQKMIQVSVNNIVGIPNEQLTVNLLSSYEDPINTPKTQLRLNGPRMGVSYVGGLNGKILMAPESEGGFDGMPFTALVGYQYEVSYLSSGSFQALFEFIGFVGGLEQSRFVPSLTIMNGFRSNKMGIEFAFGPIIELTKVAEGVYNENGDWILRNDAYRMYDPMTFDIVERFDSRGSGKLMTSWVWAAGKTFKSGYLNIPVNVYFAMKPTGYIVGASFGFNISKR